MATKGWSIGALANALTAFAFSDPADIYKAAYPVGCCVMFANWTSPNTAFPGTVWVEVNDGRSIQAAPSIDLIGSIGGVNSAPLSAANIPSHAHGWSGSVASTELSSKTTDSAGDHTHTVAMTLVAAGSHVHAGRYRNSNPSFSGGSSNNRTWATDIGYSLDGDAIQASGAHTHTVNVQSGINSAGHLHTVELGSHTHPVSSAVSSTGSGAVVDYTNTYMMFGVWKRIS